MEKIEHEGVLFAEVIRADETVETSTFYSGDDCPLQFGLLAHASGFVEGAHHHHPVERKITGTHQMFVMQRGKVKITFYEDSGRCFDSVILGPGDAIVLADGIHDLEVLEDFQAVSVKQGPFMGVENDKINASFSS